MTSRRDDLISLCYLLIYLLNKGNLKGIDLSQNLSRNESFNLVKKAKMNHSISEFCCDNASNITRFCEVIFKLQFKETPNYKLLRDLLRNGLTQKQSKKIVKKPVMNDDSDSGSSIDCDEESDHEPISTNSQSSMPYHKHPMSKKSGITSNDIDMD